MDGDYFVSVHTSKEYHKDMKEKRLTRSADDRMLAGVAGGLAEYIGIDPALVRILFIILAIFGGGFTGIIIYAILWIIMPEQSG